MDDAFLKSVVDAGAEADGVDDERVDVVLEKVPARPSRTSLGSKSILRLP